MCVVENVSTHRLYTSVAILCSVACVILLFYSNVDVAVHIVSRYTIIGNMIVHSYYALHNICTITCLVLYHRTSMPSYMMLSVTTSHVETPPFLLTS